MVLLVEHTDMRCCNKGDGGCINHKREESFLSSLGQKCSRYLWNRTSPSLLEVVNPLRCMYVCMWSSIVKEIRGSVSVRSSGTIQCLLESGWGAATAAKALCIGEPSLGLESSFTRWPRLAGVRQTGRRHSTPISVAFRVRLPALVRSPDGHQNPGPELTARRIELTISSVFHVCMRNQTHTLCFYTWKGHGALNEMFTVRAGIQTKS